MNLLLITHVLAAILFLGPATVAVSLFPKSAFNAHEGDNDSRGMAKVMARITQTYGLLSLLVPVAGLALMIVGKYFSNGLLHAAILLSVIAWGILFALILPRQRKMLAGLGLSTDGEPVDATPMSDEEWLKTKKQLSMFSGIFSLVWLITAVIMFV